MMAFFRDHFARIINHWAGKVTILVLTFAYLGVAIWGCFGLKQGLELKNLAPDDSYVGDFYEAEETYFYKYQDRVQVVVHTEIDSKDKADRVNELITELEVRTDYFVGGKSTSSWLRDYQAYCVRTAHQIDYSNLFDSYFDSFLMQPAYKKYKDDVLVDTNIFRFIVASNFSDTDGERLMMFEGRKVASNYPDLDVTIYSPMFIFIEQYVEVKPNTIQNLSIAVISMLIVSLLLIPHPVVSVFIILSIASICCGVVGYMALWEVSLDTVSMINIVMCIGFCVDFSAHITYAFVTSESRTRKDRVKDALYALGLPLIQSAASTILALIPLALSNAYIFRTFFKVLFLVILFGVLHGLFVIPVLLSMFGPTGKEKTDQASPNPSVKAVPVESHDPDRVPNSTKGDIRQGHAKASLLATIKNSDVENGEVKDV